MLTRTKNLKKNSNTNEQDVSVYVYLVGLGKICNYFAGGNLIPSKIYCSMKSDYKGAALSKSYLNVIGIIMPSLKSIEQFQHVQINDNRRTHGPTLIIEKLRFKK